MTEAPHKTWCSTNRWGGRGSDPCNCRDPRPDPLEGVRPRQLPGMARLMPLTDELLAHYSGQPLEVDMTEPTPEPGAEQPLPASDPVQPQGPPEDVPEPEQPAAEQTVDSTPVRPQEPDPGVQPPGQVAVDGLRTDALPVEVPFGWVIRWRVTGKDRMSDPWVEQEFPDRQAALGWAQARAFLLPREDGTHVRCVLVQAAQPEPEEVA